MSAALQREDREARRRAQTSFAEPLVLEAGAGTGKTSTLVARLLHWCLGPGWDGTAAEGEASADGAVAADEIARRVLQGVVAITFTEAAAAEMARRVGAALVAIATGGEPPIGMARDLLAGDDATVAARAAALVGALDLLTVQTFHAWSRSLLAAWPLEARIHPELTVDADGLATERIAEETLVAELGELYGDRPEAPAVRLVALGVGPEAIRESLLALVEAGVPAGELADAAFTPERLRPLTAQLVASARMLVELPAAAWEGYRSNELAPQVADACRATIDWLGGAAVDAASGAWVERLAAVWPKNLSNRLRAWGKGDMGKKEAERLGPYRDRIAPACRDLAVLLDAIAPLDPTGFELMRRVLHPLLQATEAERARHGIVSFDDLLDRAVRLLRERPDVCAVVRSRCDQLLVDEFQDTDPRQCELVRRLALDGPPEDRPGLFIVGDPKQSLYGWRQADLAAYAAFLDEVVAAGGEIRRLTVNYRSVPAVLEAVDRAIRPVMVESRGLQPAFAELLPFRDPAGAAETLPPVEYWSLWELADGRLQAPRAEAAARQEMAAVIDELLATREATGRWSDTALLLRRRTHLPVVLDALRAAAIPYQVSAERTFYQRREVVDAAALFRAVAQPRDRLALATLLRSAAIGVPDAALVPLFAGGLDGMAAELASPTDPVLTAIEALARRVAASLPDDVPGLAALAGWEENLIAGLRALAQLRDAIDSDTVDRFIDRLRDLLLIDATEAARSQGAFRCANLDRFFAELEGSLESDGDLAGLLRFLRRSVDEARESPAAPPAVTEDAVQVMTIHGAKGLDFDRVYLLQVGTEDRPPRSATASLARRPPAAEGRWALQLHGAANLEWPLARRLERRREAAERVRLLYVAMTRARDRLVVSGTWSPEPRPPVDALAANSLRALLELGPGRPASFQELWESSDPAAASAGDDGPWRILLPGGDTVPPAPPRPAIDWIPSEEALTALFARQASRRLAAAAREATPLVVRASDRARLRPDATSGRVASPDATREDGGEAEPSKPGPTIRDEEPAAAARAVAPAVGSAIHQLLERWDPAADPQAELERLRGILRDELEAALPPSLCAAAHERAERLLDLFATGPLFDRWLEILPHVEARELPILLPWPPERADAEPQQAVTGTIDLIYRDPSTLEPVIVDFKTDHPVAPLELAERAERHTLQLAAYRMAVARGLDLASPPRFELWFLGAGERIEVR